MTVDDSKALKKGTRVYWRGNAADSTITETSWDAVAIAPNNGKLAKVHYEDFSERRRSRIQCDDSQSDRNWLGR
jgi:hypothetical protein